MKPRLPPEMHPSNFPSHLSRAEREGGGCIDAPAHVMAYQRLLGEGSDGISRSVWHVEVSVLGVYRGVAESPSAPTAVAFAMHKAMEAFLKGSRLGVNRDCKLTEVAP